MVIGKPTYVGAQGNIIHNQMHSIIITTQLAICYGHISFEEMNVHSCVQYQLICETWTLQSKYLATLLCYGVHVTMYHVHTLLKRQIPWYITHKY